MSNEKWIAAGYSACASTTTAALLGLLQREPRAFLQEAPRSNRNGDGKEAAENLTPADIDMMIAARVAAKQAKNYAEADRIRAVLLEAGIALEDKPGGLTEWRRA